ncbi:hypothetical protein K488DRAFT_89815 [Vararia minispora EC-137]|uniref:Uncharacterized protein n=1 Tax=Vararia minispora EC-137 TaxID=1314806 RepID=A0ACB8Q9U6_9AGAM|nr:hypothetical protein K488DRAFT_89815 [Vararia minispora EC-137]
MSSPIDIRLSFGQVLIGAILGSVFYGTVLLQTGLYFGSTRRNDVRNNVLVVVLNLLELFAWILEVYCVWWYFVLNYANPEALGNLNWSLSLDPFINYTITLIGQMFFVEKIWILGKSHLLGIVLTVLALSGWATGIAIGILTFIQHTTGSTQINNINYFSKAAETLVELLIAICMVFLLRKMRTGIQKSDQILNNLIIFMLSRGIVVCIVQIIYTGTSFTSTLIWIAPHFCIGKLATNAVLASLNVRELVKIGFGRKGLSASATEDNDIVMSSGPSARLPAVSMEPIEFGPVRSDISTQSDAERDRNTKADGNDLTMYSAHSIDRVTSAGHRIRARGVNITVIALVVALEF